MVLNLFRKKDKKRKVVVVGLDGVPYTLLKEYMHRGLMPEFAKLCEDGNLFRMKSTLPEISSVAWSSFMTGSNPGEHGIFGFMNIDGQTYEYTFPNFNSLQKKPFWESNNIKSVVLNLPQTYPARPMNGVMVSGFVALDLQKATYPEHIYSYLKNIGYKIDVQAQLASQDPEAFFLVLSDTFEKRKKAIEHLYENEDWQLFIGTITETDRLHHFFYDSAEEGQYYPVFEDFYRKLDSFIGNMAKRAERDGAVFLTCSDHGFTPIKTEVYLNRWLDDNGYLQLEGVKDFKGIKPETKAFCLDPSRIYLHLEGEYKKGSVRKDQCQEVVKELTEKFLKIEYEGEKIIQNVYLKEDIFHGKCANDGPDIYLLSNYGYDLKGSLRSQKVFGVTNFKGMHTYDDAHLFSSANDDLEDVSIENIAAIILNHLS